ncbi:hypothetical protein [Senimuribacter intestinalis]|uniref:MuF-C-terminal domain-containing protein n=1 Tax=Senimuribacter intestinalis TaxID=2941507 RepID=UPI00203E3FC8|nr:hypothetical protein [Senimuribacter intestinalis]
MAINWDKSLKIAREADEREKKKKLSQASSSSGSKRTSQSSYKQVKFKSAVATGAKAGASAAKSMRETVKNTKTSTPKNSQIDEKTGKFRTDNAKNKRSQERRKGSRGYYVSQGNKEAGEKIGNIVKGTGKQLGSQYMNAASMMYAPPSKGRIRKEMHVQSNRQHGTNDRRFVGKTPAEIAAYRLKAKQDEAKVDKQHQQIKATADASAKELQTKASALRQSGAEDLEKAKEGMGALGRSAVDVSSALLMWGGNAALGAVTGAGSLPFMFIQGFGDASMTAREAGATKGQQAFVGLAAGGAATATEKISSLFGPFKKTVGKGIFDNPIEKVSFKLANGITDKLVKKGLPKNAVYKAVRATVKGSMGMAAEGSEEAIEDFVQPLYERVYDKDALKQYGTKEYWQNVRHDFGIGAAMAGVLGGGSAVMNGVRNSDTKSTEPYTEKEKAQAIQAAKAQSEESDAYKFAQTLEAQQKSGKEVLDAQIDDLVQKTVAEEYERNRTIFEAQEAAEKEQRMVAEKAGDIDGYLPKKGFVNDVYGRNIQNVVALRVDNNASRIEQNLINVFHADPETAAVQAKSIARIKTGTATAEDLRVASVDNIPARKVLMRELKMKLPATNAETMKALTEHEAVIRAVQKQSILKEAQQSARAELFQRFTVGMDDTTADIFAAGMEKVQLADMPKFMEAFATYYEGGRVNYNYDQIPIAKAYQGYITEDIKMAAYQAGNQVYLAEQEQATAMQQQVVKGERTRGTLELSERNARKLGKEQSNALRMVADVTGKNIVVVDQIDAGSRKDVANGKYQDGVIYISAKSQAPVFDVLKHELTHNLQETAPEAYQELKDYVFRKFYEADKNKYDEMVRSMVERYAASGVELTRAQAEDELLADATDAFFTDYAAISELALENRSLGEKLLDGIRSLLDTFHRLATRSHGEDNASAKGKWLEEIDALKEAERLWVKALNESIGVKNEGSQAKYSIKYDNIGQPYVLLDQNVVASKPNSVKMHNYIADLIAEDIGNFYPIIESGQKVYIGKDLPSEFTQSKYTRWLMRNRKKLLNVKNQTSQEIGEIIEIATNRRWEKNLKDKHNKDAKYGFYKYSTRFVISHKSNREAYEATLVIRNDADGHKYLYDITDIKKVDDLHLASTLQESHDYTGDIKSQQVSSTNDSISDSSQKSNESEKFSLESKEMKALNEGVGVKTGQSEAKYSINEKFYDEFDRWMDTTTQEERKQSGGFFNVGTVSEALKSIGVRGEKISFHKAKIAKIMEEHPEMSAEVIKGIPRMIEQPIVVMQSKTKLNSITILGELKGSNGDTVMAAMKLAMNKPNATVHEIEIITSAYSRTRKNIQGLLTESKILYIEPNKNRTNDWLSSLRVQFPSDVTKYGSIDRVAYVDEKGNSFSKNNAIAEAFKKAEQKSNSNGKLSLKSQDSERRTLSRNQQAYFKDSKVRDEQGRLLVMYHGTPEAGFTEFREGTYFTQNKEYADNYQNPGASSLRVKSSAGNPDTYKVFLNIKKPFDTRNSQERAIFESKFYQKWGTGTPLMESGLPDWTDGMDLQEFIEEMGYDYDGLILDEGGTGGFGEDVKRRGLSYVVFDSSQVKNVDNQNPTDSPDIRYQLKNGDIREFNMTKHQALDNMKAVANMKPVAVMIGNEFAKGQDDLITQVSRYFDQIGNVAKNQILGDVELDRNGVKSSLGHGIGRNKAVAFTAVPKVIEQGQIIDAQYKWKGRSYDTVVLAAPISINKVDFYMGVVVNRNKQLNDQSYYLHEVGIIQQSSVPSKTAATQMGSTRGGNTAPLISLLQQLNNVNNLTVNDIVTDVGRFQLKDNEETPQERISSLEKEVERLKGEFKRSKIAVPDPKQTGREVTKLMDAYIGKRLPVVHQSIMEDMKKLFAEMRKPDGNWNLVDDLCRNVAEKVVSNMEILHDEYWQQYTDLRKSLKNTTLKLDETYWNDVVDFEDLRKAHFGTLSLSRNKGVSIDTYYQELAETYPELFDASEYTNEVDQLYNIIDTVEGMRPYTEDYSEGEIAEFADTIAKDVLQLGYDLSQKETFADRAYNEKMEAIEKVKAERNALMKEQRKRANERLEKKDQFYKDKIREIKEKNKDRKDRKYYTSRIEAYSQWLSDSLLRPTETKHIPENYRKAVAEMLESFDFGTKRKDKYAEKNGPSKKTIKLAALNKAYKEIMAQESSTLEADDEISTLIDDLSVALEGKRFEDLETEQLAGVYRLVKNIRFAISSANKTFSDGLKENISEYAQQVMHETSEFHYKNRKGTKHTMGDFFQWTNTTPRDAFMLMGKTMETLHQNMRNGLDRHINNTTVAMDFVEKLRKQYHIKDWIDDNARTQKFEVGGRTIELVPSQVMSLYCLMKREQAVSHIVAGSGMTSAPIPVIDKKYQKITKAWSQRVLDSSHVMPSVEEVEHIIGTLTKEQREVADALQQFMNETCADWGNETSMKLYGYKKFREKNYFPIKSSDAFLNESFDNKSNPAKIKNVGFTKNTVVNAGNPIVLDDIFNVFTQHVNTMSMYNALVPAITDFERVYNYRANVDGKQVGSVHQSLERAFGRSAIDYISQFMKDVNQNHVKNRDHEMANKLVANYKKAKIGANLRVLVQQPTAFFRANAVMDTRYLLAALPSGKSLPVLNKEAKQEMQEHCPIARWKSWGFYNTDVARDMRDIFLDKKNIADKLFMDMYGNADDLTWSIIWRAVKKEVEATKPDLKEGSEAYWNAVSERFSYVVDRTQVVDSVFHRSQIMRKTDLFSKTATSFMAEPTKTWNMLRTEYVLARRDWDAGNKKAAVKRGSRVLTTHLVTAAMTGAAAALIDALRGGGEDDDDKEFFEKWLSYAGQGFLDNANPAGLLPGVRDVLSLAQGYDVSRMDMAGFADLVNSLQYWKSDTATTYFALKKTVGGIASLTGLPVGSLWRDVESIARETAKLFVPEEKVEFVMKQLRYNMKDSRNRSKFAKVYAKADENGNSETAKEIRQAMLGSGADSKKWDSSVKTQRQNVIAGQAASLLNKGDEVEAKKLIGSYCMKYDWKFEKVWAKVLEESAKRKSTFQKAYDDTIGKLIRGEA